MKRATNVVLVLLLAMGVTILMTARTIAITARTPITTHIGFANTSCGSWTQARANHRSTHMEFWVIGFMSGVNYARSDWCSHRLSQCWAPQGGGSAAILGLPRGSVTILEERQGGMPRRAPEIAACANFGAGVRRNAPAQAAVARVRSLSEPRLLRLHGCYRPP